MKSSSSNHVKQSKLKGFIFGVTVTFCAVVGIGQALAVINVSSILDKVPGTGLSLSEINAIIGTIRGISNDSGKIGIGTTAPNAELEVDGNIIADEPTASNHVATKNYVDNNSGGGDTGHYFVLSHDSWNGNLGGLAGANAKCRADLETYDWKGKSEVNLATADIKAWLCDSSTCNNFTPNTQYQYASSGFTAYGGGQFYSDAIGAGPNDLTDWSDNRVFGRLVTVWSNRKSVDLVYEVSVSSLSPREDWSGYTCSDYTTSTNTTVSGRRALTATGDSRYDYIDYVTNVCASSQYLYCFVN